MSCTFNGSDYSPGSIICIRGTAHRCNGDGTWEDLRETCVQADGVVVRNEESERVLPAD